MPQGPQGLGQLVMQQHMHEATHIRPRTARTGHEKQMLADVWQQSMDDDDARTDNGHDDVLDEDDDDDDVSIIEPDGHTGVLPAVLQPEEDEEEAPAAGDTFMVSFGIPM